MTRIIASLLVSALAAPGALADEWRMQDDGELHFEPTWEGDVVPGRFGDFDVRLDTGEGGIAGSELVVTVSLESASNSLPERAAELERAYKALIARVARS